MTGTANLHLPLLQPAQAQKHVTHNEALLLLDGIVQLSVLDRDLAAPPASPPAGSRYIVASGGSGAWHGWDAGIALWADGAWHRLAPRPGWICWVEDESAALVWTGTAWTPLIATTGLLARAAQVEVARGPAGFGTAVAVAEELLAGLSGASATTVLSIPGGSLLFGVTSRVVTAITGATTFDCGIPDDPILFGEDIAISPGTTHVGVIAPMPIATDTTIRLRAQGGDFSAGAVRVAAHYLRCIAP